MPKLRVAHPLEGLCQLEILHRENNAVVFCKGSVAGASRDRQRTVPTLLRGCCSVLRADRLLRAGSASGSSFQQRTQDFRAFRIGVSSFESVHAPIRIKAVENGLRPRAPGTHRCPRKSLVPDRVQKGVTSSQTLWFSQPETGTSARQARGLGVLEKLSP